jgi:DEAD/DEAH box helicase domain-containing protein
LDVAELAYGRQLTLERWLEQGNHLAGQFVDAYQGALEDVVVGAAGPLLTLQTSGKAAVIGHPLWRREEPFWNEAQAEAAQLLRAKGFHVGMSDVRQLRNRPESLYRMLT